MSKRWMMGWFVCVVVGASVGLVACGGPTPAECGTTGVSFSKCVQPIFAKSCGGSGCHGAGQLAPVLTEGARSNIVDATSTRVPTKKFVVPSNSADSYLYQKITLDKPEQGGRMPLGGSALSASDLQLIKTWIDEGAKDN